MPVGSALRGKRFLSRPSSVPICQEPSCMKVTLPSAKSLYSLVPAPLIAPRCQYALNCLMSCHASRVRASVFLSRPLFTAFTQPATSSEVPGGNSDAQSELSAKRNHQDI